MRWGSYARWLREQAARGYRCAANRDQLTLEEALAELDIDTAQQGTRLPQTDLGRIGQAQAAVTGAGQFLSIAGFSAFAAIDIHLAVQGARGSDPLGLTGWMVVAVLLALTFGWTKGRRRSG